MFPVIFQLGPITLYSYGLMLAVAFLVTGHLLGREFLRRGLSSELAGGILTAAIIGGIVGAKIYYLLEHLPELRQDPFGLVFSGSGLVAYGGFLGGIVASLLVIRRHGVAWREVFDAAAPLLALGYAIGRIGCLLAGDGDYGPPSDLPWAMAFPDGVIPTTERVHPTPLYETVVMAGVFAILWRLRLEPWPPGRLFALYLVLAGVERLVIEHWRINPTRLGPLSGAQVLAALSAMLGVVWLASLSRRRPATG